MIQQAVTLLFTVSWVLGQTPLNPRCACDVDTTSTTATWGSWTSFSVPQCKGQCGNTVLYGESWCNLYLRNGTLRGSLLCRREHVDGCDLCDAEWSQWGSIGECDAVCTFGLQLQSRTCYLKNTPENVRSDRCAGQFGVFDQYKNKSCSRFNNCGNTLSSRSSTTARTRTPISEVNTTSFFTVPTIKTKKENYSLPTLEEGTDSNNVSPEPGVTVTSATSNTSKSSTTTSSPATSTEDAGFDTFTLAVVLGAFAIVCVAAVFITATVVMFRKKTHHLSKVNYSTNNGESALNFAHQARRENNNLPEKKSSTLILSKLRNFQTEENQTVPNDLYETTIVEDEEHLALKTNGEIYLQPNSLTNIDSVYFSIEDTSM